MCEVIRMLLQDVVRCVEVLRRVTKKTYLWLSHLPSHFKPRSNFEISGHDVVAPNSMKIRALKIERWWDYLNKTQDWSARKHKQNTQSRELVKAAVTAGVVLMVASFSYVLLAQFTPTRLSDEIKLDSLDLQTNTRYK